MMELGGKGFSRYLRAKQQVDDRSLNRWVYDGLRRALPASGLQEPWRLVEFGCGSGAMLTRLWDWQLAPRLEYTAVDRDEGLIAEARGRLLEFARARGLSLAPEGGRLLLQGAGQKWLIALQTADYLAFCDQMAGRAGWDLVLAHAFLDLVDLERGLPRMLALLVPGGFYYFTLNFDGATIFHPPLDPDFEAQLLRCYHESMDRRHGGRGGHSQTGRRLLLALSRGGAEVRAAGSSDWVVWPDPQGSYPGEEAYFLTYLLETIRQAMAAQPGMDRDRLEAWAARRRRQIEAGELIFMAHQLDLWGRRR